MSNTDKIQQCLLNRKPMFFASEGRDFRIAFRQRWYTSMKKHKLRVVVVGGDHEGVNGTFVWTEDLS